MTPRGVHTYHRQWALSSEAINRGFEHTLAVAGVKRVRPYSPLGIEQQVNVSICLIVTSRTSSVSLGNMLI